MTVPHTSALISLEVNMLWNMRCPMPAVILVLVFWVYQEPPGS